MSTILTSQHQYRTFDTTYLFKIKNQTTLTLKILNLSHECLFKQHITSQDLDFRDLNQGRFEPLLQNLADKKLIPQKHLPPRSQIKHKENCEKAFKHAIEKAKSPIFVEHKDLERYTCPITLEVFQDPVIDDHGHTFEKTAIEHHLKQKNECPVSRQPINSLTPNRVVKDTIEEWGKKDPIPTFNKYQKDNPRLAENNLQMARSCIEEKEYHEALDFYQKAFQYTQNWMHYKNVPQLFEQMQEPEKAHLARLHLAYYQYQVGEYQEALQTLESSTKNTPDNTLLIELYHLTGNQKKALNLTIETAQLLSSSHPEQALQLYMTILKEDPTQLSLYSPLAALIDNPLLKSQILLKGALHAFQLEKDLIAEKLIHEAQTGSQNTFIDEQPLLDLFQKQQNTLALKKHLQHISQTLENTGKRHEALQAYKMLFQIEKDPSISQKIVELYTHQQNNTKATHWSLIHLDLLLEHQAWEQAHKWAKNLLKAKTTPEIPLYEKLEQIYTHWQGHKLENLWHKLGKAYQDASQLQSAEKTYRKAHEKFQGLTQALDLAQLLAQQDKTPETVQLYYQASLQALAQQNFDQHAHIKRQMQKIDPAMTHLSETQKTNLLMQSQIVILQTNYLKVEAENQRLSEKVKELEKIVQPLKDEADRKEQERQAELKQQEEKAWQEELERTRRAELEMKRREELSQMWFGKAKWAQYFGDVGVEPPLPPNIQDILDAHCPIWPGKRVHETHLLTLIPATINGQPLTLQKLGELVQKPLQGPATKYRYFNIGQYTDQPTQRSHWTLLTRDVIPNSTSKNYADQQQVALAYGGYEIPNVLDTAVTLFMEHVQSGTRLYEGMYTRCQEKWDANYQLAVGGFAAGGLLVNRYFDGDARVGVGVSRKFV